MFMRENIWSLSQSAANKIPTEMGACIHFAADSMSNKNEIGKTGQKYEKTKLKRNQNFRNVNLVEQHTMICAAIKIGYCATYYLSGWSEMKFLSFAIAIWILCGIYALYFAAQYTLVDVLMLSFVQPELCDFSLYFLMSCM